LKELIPSYGQSLADNVALCRQVRAETAAVLNINNITEKESITV
jgi:malate dehydrogenase (quinone)